MNIDVSAILANLLGTLGAAAVLFFGGLIVLDERKFRPWVYNLRPAIADVLLKVVDFVYNPYSWAVVFFVSLFALFSNKAPLLNAALLAIIFVRFLKMSGQVKVFPVKSSDFSDGFHEEKDIAKSWSLKTGKASLDDGKGNPRPSLLLKMADPAEATNTFLFLKEIEAERGVIECEIFLNPGSVVNIVFFGDIKNDNWHMARYDSRDASNDGLLVKDKGKGVNWRFNSMSAGRTNVGTWYKARVEFSSERARMFRNGELIAEITNPQMFGKQIGIFNECDEVSVDNFRFSK